MDGCNNNTVEYEELDTPEGKLWNDQGILYDEGFVKLGSVKGVFARSYLRFYDHIKNFRIFDDDIWVISFPKTGTTWTQEMVWCIQNNLDFEAATEDLETRFPFFEIRANWSPKLASLIRKNAVPDAPPPPLDSTERDPFFPNSFEYVETLKRPRFIKCHLHFSLLPQQLIDGCTKAKIIYVARNPKDTCVSFYHHCKLVDGYSGNLEDFVEQFITDNVYCAPFWTHLKEFWEIRNRSDMLYIKYEDMKKNLPEVINRTANFLGKSLNEEEVEVLEEHLSFENMKNNPAVNLEKLIQNLKKIHGKNHDSKFIRKGQVGSWKDELPPKIMSRFDQWIEENSIKGLYP